MKQAGVVLRTRPKILIRISDGRTIEALSTSKGHWIGEKVSVLLPSDGRSKAKIVVKLGELIPDQPNQEGDVIMSRSIMSATLVGVHCLSAGFYTPAYIKPDGSRVSSRIVINVRGNEQIGNKSRSTDFQLTIWSAKESKPGQGMAEKMARLCHVGKELAYVEAVMREYETTVKNKDGVIFANADGTPVKIKQSTLVVDNSKCQPGSDATKRIQTEVSNFNALGDKSPAACGFNARPENWDRAGSADAVIWKGITDFRSAQLPVVGSKLYGYANLCAVPAGCTAIGMAPVAGAADVAAAAEMGAALPAENVGDDFPGDAQLEAHVGDDVPF